MFRYPFARKQHGVTLIITLIMVVVIGLTAAAAMRGATASERVVNNIRMLNLAQQYAEAGLKYCETQLTLVSGSRTTSLADSAISVTLVASPLWAVSTTWTSSPTAVTSVPAAFVTSTNSAFVPAQLPVCFAERSVVGTGTVTVVTARGFSPDYERDSSTKETIRGSVVWLQSILTLR